VGNRYIRGLQAGRPVFESWQRQNFLFTASRPASRPIQPPIQWIPAALSPRLKQPGSEDDHSPPTSAELKNCGAIIPLLRTLSWHSA
jgi:hypothetical protein